MISRRNFQLSSLAALPLSSALVSGTAQAQPTRPTRLVVGFPAGGGSDVAARALASRIQSAYPAGIVIDNKPGAGARLAIDHVKNSPPDGTTMLFTPDFPITIYPHSYRKLAYDSLKDLTPVAIVARTPLAFVVGPAVPESVKTVADFVAWAKANPKLAAFSSSAAGATPHFAGVMFSRAAGVDLLHVAYKGGAPAMQDMLGGQIASGFPGVGEALPQLSGGKLRVLATTGPQRTRFLPDVPTMAESGYRDVVAEVWVGVFMPSRTPAAIVNHAATAIAEAQKSAEFNETFAKFAMEPVVGTPESFGQRIRADLAAWGPIIKASGFTAED